MVVVNETFPDDRDGGVGVGGDHLVDVVAEVFQDRIAQGLWTFGWWRVLAGEDSHDGGVVDRELGGQPGHQVVGGLVAVSAGWARTRLT